MKSEVGNWNEEVGMRKWEVGKAEKKEGGKILKWEVGMRKWEIGPVVVR